MEKNILVLVDFTAVSVNALTYAAQQFVNDRITVVHVIQGLMDLDNGLAIQGNTTSIESWENQLKSFIDSNISSLPESIEPKILVGQVVPMVRKYVEDHDVDAVVMGTRDKYDLFDRWIGTISLGVVKTLDVPVYLIPKYAEYKKYQKIMVASDYRFEDDDAVELIKDWNTKYQAFTKFLHVSKKPIEENPVYEKISTAIVDSDLDFPHEISLVQDKNISESLLASAYNFGAELLVVLAENHSFVHSMIFNNLSKELILKSTIPMLFLNLDD